MRQNERRKRVLFVCTHNSARSQMAEGILRALYPESYDSYSAGTEPSRVDPNAVQVMAEMGIDISSQRSKSVSEFLDRKLDLVVTLCDHAKHSCPFFPGGKEMLHRGFEDPAAFKGSGSEKIAVFRRVRDEIQSWIEEVFGKSTEKASA
jgi:arsenate reductase